jgi:hypothetical protein
MRTTGRWLLVSWLVPALVMLGLDGRLPILFAWATPSTLLVLVVGVLIRQQRAPSFLDRPPLPYRYRIADDLGQPVAAVVAAAEHEATRTSDPTARGSDGDSPGIIGVSRCHSHAEAADVAVQQL